MTIIRKEEKKRTERGRRKGEFKFEIYA